MAQAVAFTPDVEGGGVVEEPVEQGDGEDGIGEVLVPLVEAFFGGEEDRFLGLVTLVDDLEQEGGVGLLEGEVADLVELCGAAHKSTHVKTLVMWSKGPWPRTRFRRRRPDFT